MTAATMPDLDLDHVAEVFGDPDSARPMLEYFLETVEPSVDALGRLAAQNDFEALRGTLHTIGGAARTAGARRLGDLCARLEADLIDGRRAAAIRRLGVVREAFDCVGGIIRAGTIGRPA